MTKDSKAAREFRDVFEQTTLLTKPLSGAQPVWQKKRTLLHLPTALPFHPPLQSFIDDGNSSDRFFRSNCLTARPLLQECPSDLCAR